MISRKLSGLSRSLNRNQYSFGYSGFFSLDSRRATRDNAGVIGNGALRTEIAVAKVELYTTTSCPFCVRAKALLRTKAVQFQEIDVTDDDALREKMIELAGGRRTVPEIFINGQLVGGYDELRAFDKTGELDRMLAQPG